MKHLILIRHAKSDWHSAADSDFERPLNKRGKKAAPLMGQRLAARGYDPDRMVSSPAERARQTVGEIAKEINFPQQDIEFHEAIYEADLTTLLNLVRNLDDDADTIILVGHNPGFSELGQWLSDAAPDWLPTCGLLELELPIDSWAQINEQAAELLCYDYPKNTA